MKTYTLCVVGLFALAGCDDPPVEEEELRDGCEGQTSGTACTWAGVKGAEGYNGDDVRYRTRLNQVQDMVFLPDGSGWFTDFNNYLLRKVLPDGNVETVVGWTDPVFPGDGPIEGLPADGAAGLEWRLNHPTGLFLAPDGAVMIVGWHNHKLLRVDPLSGWVQVACGGGAGFAGDGGPAKMALFKQPMDASVDEDGNIYVVDQQNWRVRKIDAADVITTIAGSGMSGDSGDGGPAIEAQFSWEANSNPNPSGGILYHAGKLYISDTEVNRIRVMDLATGMIDAFAGTGGRASAETAVPQRRRC
jgi:serine/threonine-protein kinase